MASHNILQVPKWTVSLFMLTVIGWLVFIILAGIGFSNLFREALSHLMALLFISILVFGSGFLFYKILRKIVPRKMRLISIGTETVSIDKEVEFKWNEILSYRRDSNSAIVDRLIIQLRNGRKITLLVMNEMTQVMILEEIQVEIINGMKLRSLPISNYYNSKTWRVVAYSFILSIPIIPIILVSLGFDLEKNLAALVMYAGTSLTAALSILMNSKKK